MPVPESLWEDVKRALQEDIGSGDVTAALLPPESRVRAEILAREPLLLCGQPWVDATFKAVDAGITVSWHFAEGARLDTPSVLCTLQGPARSILTAERTALNFLQTLSATATVTWEALTALRGFKTRLLDTRKTLPGLRQAQKYAVRTAGGTNHRFGLYDAFLIKENHIRAMGSIHAAITAARLQRPDLMIEVEVETLSELQEALKAAPHRILLDNFSLEMLKEAVLRRGNAPCELEASGGISGATLADVARTGVDFISMGALTKSVRAIDLSLLIREEA